MMISRLEETVLEITQHNRERKTPSLIFRTIENNNLPKTTIGTIHSTLERMLKDGLVTRNKGLPAPIRGGRAQYQYDLTDSGYQALDEARRVRAALDTFGSNRSAKLEPPNFPALVR